MSAEPTTTPAASASRRHMSPGQRLLFFVVAWLILLMPFLFWWNTWFGRQLSDQQLTEYLHDDHKPRHIQHALVQIGERINRHDAGVARWYPDLVRLAAYPVDEVRNTDAWVMGQDVTSKAAADAGFHQALLKMLNDPSLTVRGNAALSLVRFGDASGRPQIVALLQPAKVTAPQAGKVIDTASVGTAIHQGGILAKLQAGAGAEDVRAPISGRLRNLYVQAEQNVPAGAEIAVIEPSDDQVWEALRGLYLVGQPEDLAAVLPYEHELPGISDRVRQQAAETEKAIRERASR
jgi:biotin carboxyl carrier protein